MLLVAGRRATARSGATTSHHDNLRSATRGVSDAQDMATHPHERHNLCMTNEESDALRRRRQEAFEAVQSHIGLAALHRWQEWGIVVRAFSVNERELLSLIHAPSRDGELAIELIQNVRPTDTADTYFAEMYRLLHNYLASVKTLVDHSRNLKGEYDNSPFSHEYERRVKALGNEPVVGFVQSLRNVILHQRLPVVSIQVSVDTPNSKPEFSLNFVTESLLKIDRFSKTTREYVRSHGSEQWPVKTPVQQYSKLINELCDWTATQFQTEHGDDMSDYQRAVAELQGLTPPGPTDEELRQMLAKDDADAANTQKETRNGE